MKLKILCILLLIIALTNTYIVQAQTQNEISFPAQTLAQRIEQIITLTNRQIAYDISLIKDIHVPAYIPKTKNLEEWLETSLKDTPFTYKKQADGNYYLVRITQKSSDPASSSSGSLRGRILEAETSEPLPGATVKIVETNLATMTDLDGYYNFPKAPAGQQIIEVSFMGYTNEKTEVRINGNRTNMHDIKLSPDANQLKEVVVTGEHNQASTVGLYARQRESVAMTDGISAEQMKLTADSNMAQVLKRVSGVTMQDSRFVVVRGMSERYNNVQLNGSSLPSSEPNRRNFSFDVLPSNLVDNVVVSKTFTPDMSGEFSGGTVQVSTLSIPDEAFFALNAGAGLNTQSTGKDFWNNTRYKGDWLLGTDARDWFKNGWVDRYNNAERQEKQDIAAEIPNHWGLQRFMGAPTQNYAVSGGVPFRFQNGSSFGFIGALTYRHEESREDYEWQDRFFSTTADDGIKTSAVTTIAGLFNIGWKNRRHRVDFRSIYNRRFTHESSRQTDINDSDLPELKLVSSVRENTLWQTRLQGEHRFAGNKLKIDWFADYNELERYQPDDRFNAAYVYGLDNQSGELLFSWLASRPGESVGHKSAGMYASLLNETKKNIGGNAEYSFKIAGNTQKIKAGYWGTFRTAGFKQTTIVLLEPVSTRQSLFLPVQELFTPENFAAGRYGFDFWTFAPSTDLTNGDKYDGTQDIHAGYLMADISFFKSRLHLIGGMRLENSTMAINTFSRFLNNNDEMDFYWADSLVVHTKNDWLPSLTAAFDISPKLKIRAAYSKTIARADFRERSAFYYYDMWERVVMRGGTSGLRDAVTENYDLRLEYYPSPGEIISVSAFYKDFIDPVEIVAIRTNSGQVARFVNLQEAMAKGLELNLRKHFGFIARPLQNLYLNANLTLMDGTVRLEPARIDDMILRSEPRDRLPNGLSPLVWNAGLAYEGDILGAALNYNYVGHRVRYAGVDKFMDEYEAQRGGLDAQVSARLFKGRMEVKLNASDITAAPYIIYHNQSGEPIRWNDEGNAVEWAYFAEGGEEYNEGDRILRKSRRGTTFSASVSWRF